MKLPSDAVIAREKVTNYLLVRQSRSDKSAFLERAGYTVLNPDMLISDLALLVRQEEAEMVDENKFGRYFQIVGTLHGSLEVRLRVRTIWMTEHLSGITKFVTLIPIEIHR